MTRMYFNLLSAMVIALGSLSLAAGSAAATEEEDTCNTPSGGSCTGETCCVSGDFCSTDPEFCRDLFCDNNPESSICEEEGG